MHWRGSCIGAGVSAQDRCRSRRSEAGLGSQDGAWSRLLPRALFWLLRHRLESQPRKHGRMAKGDAPFSRPCGASVCDCQLALTLLVFCFRTPVGFRESGYGVVHHGVSVHLGRMQRKWLERIYLGPAWNSTESPLSPKKSLIVLSHILAPLVHPVQIR